MDYEEICKAISGYESINKDQADVFAKASIVMMTIIIEKYKYLDPEGERRPLENAISAMKTFIELPM